MAGKANDDDLPSLDDVMNDDTGNKGGKDDDDGLDGLSIDFSNPNPFSDDDGSEIENDPNRAKGKADEIVFEEEDSGEDGDGNLADFDEKKDKKQGGDNRKQSRVQREMRLKREARAQTFAMKQAIDRIVEDTTTAYRIGFTNRKNGAQIFYNNAVEDLKRADEAIKRAEEDNDSRAISELVTRKNEINEAMGKARRIIEDLPDDFISNFVYDPKLPLELQRASVQASKGQDWMDANSSWYNDPNRAAEVAATREIDKALAKEGKLDVNTEEYFTELTRRVARRFPDIDVHTTDGRVARFSGRRRGGSGQRDVTGSGGQRGASQGAARTGANSDNVVTAEEREMLKGLGIDLTNKEHVAEFKKNRANSRR